MEILWWKVISIFVMMLLVWFGGFLPTQLHALAEDKRQFALGLGNAFSGGVFLCVGLVHLLPEAAEQIEHLNYKFNETVPIAYVIAMGGFLLIFWIEKILLSSSDPEEHRAVFLHLHLIFDWSSFYSSPKSDCSNSVQGRSQRHGGGRHRGTCALPLPSSAIFSCATRRVVVCLTSCVAPVRVLSVPDPTSDHPALPRA